MKKNYYILFLVSIILFQSCATLVNGSRQILKFSSYPSKATLTINGKPYGETPTKVKLRRYGNHAVKIELEGYHPYQTILVRKFDRVFWGNILLGGLAGMVVDALTGAMYNLTPGQVHAHFRSDTGNLYKSEDGIYVGVTLQPDPSWKKIGKMEKE